MNKPIFITIIAVMTAISGVTYYTLSDKNLMLRGGNGTVPTPSEVYTKWVEWCATYGKQY